MLPPPCNDRVAKSDVMFRRSVVDMSVPQGACSGCLQGFEYHFIATD